MNDPRKFRASVGSSKRKTIPGREVLPGTRRAPGLVHCHHAGARCRSPASPTSTLSRNFPWTLPWACAQSDLSRGSRTHRGLWSATAAGSSSVSLVLEDRRCKAHVAEQWQEHSHRRGTKLSGFARLPPGRGPARSPCSRVQTITWPRALPCRLCSLVKLHHSPRVLLHQPPPVPPYPPSQAALVPARADGTAVAACRRGSRRSALVVATDPPALSSAVQELESKGHMRTRCKRGLILRKRQVILTPWGLDPRILWRQLHRPLHRVQVPGRLPQRSQAWKWSSTTGRCRARLAVTSGASSVRLPERTWAAAAGVIPAVPVLRRTQRLRGSTGLERAVSPTPVAHWRNRGVQR